MRVAIIEDNVDVGVYLEAFLTQEGHEAVLVTGHFRQVLTDDFWWGVDAALVDLLLGPEINGAAVLSWMREHVPHVRRVVLSAVANHVEVKELAHVVLTKPAGASAIRHALGVERA